MVTFEWAVLLEGWAKKVSLQKIKEEMQPGSVIC